MDRIREALFSILTPHLPNAAFLDLFAGTGANGIEALSRGAKHCLFVDNAPASRALVQRNLEAARLMDAATVEGMELPRQITRISDHGAPFDVIFADPPHEFDQYNPLVEAIGREGLLAEEGILIIEHAAELNLKDDNDPLHRFRQANYGNTTLSFFERPPVGDAH
jgi:16S rRNA (guanine(966)-N(2))-methyltransferase RsmD